MSHLIITDSDVRAVTTVSNKDRGTALFTALINCHLRIANYLRTFEGTFEVTIKYLHYS